MDSEHMFVYFIDSLGLCNCSVESFPSRSVASIKGEPYIIVNGKCRKSFGTTLYVKRLYVDPMHNLLSNLRRSALDMECCDDNCVTQSQSLLPPPSCNGQRASLALYGVYKGSGFAGLWEIGDPHGQPMCDALLIQVRHGIQNTTPLHGKICVLLGISWDPERAQNCDQIGHVVFAMYDVAENKVKVMDCTKSPTPRDEHYKSNIGRLFHANGKVVVQTPHTGYLQKGNECESIATFVGCVLFSVGMEVEPELITKALGRLTESKAHALLRTCVETSTVNAKRALKPYLKELSHSYDARVIGLHSLCHSSDFQNDDMDEFVRMVKLPLYR